MHDDAHPSLSLRRLDNGVWIWKCFGCDVRGDSIAFGMELCGLSYPDAIRQLLGYTPPAASVIVAKYDYIDEDGALLYQVVRYQPKAFRQRRKTARGWQWGLENTPRVLYRLARAMRTDVLYYAEGEKDVAALEAVGLAATTNSGGAESFKWELLDPLPRATQLVIVPDNDEPGAKLCRKVFAAARARGMPDPEIAYVPAPAKDVSEHFAAGGSADFLRLTRRG